MPKKKALVIRCGALGDMLIISPIFRALRKAGYDEIVCHTGKRGMEVLKGNPFIDRYIEYMHEGKENPNVSEEWAALEKTENAEYSKNFAESVEVNISLHPKSPVYSYPKFERYARGNRNFYEVTEQISGLKFDNYKPDIFIGDDETKSMVNTVRPGKFNIVWALSGSGANKAYPWAEFVMGELIKNDPSIHIITVGNEQCQIIEPYGVEGSENFTNLSGRCTFRETMALCKMVDLVVAPDTGVLHAAGAFDTPKLGILGHTTIENVTKHFENDYSLEANMSLCECSPCFRLIYDHQLQCPIDKISGGAFCMAHGQPQMRIYEQIKKAQAEHGSKRSASFQEEVSSLQQTDD